MKIINAETLEIEDDYITVELKEDDADRFNNAVQSALNCSTDEFSEKYLAYKKAEAEFNELCAPFKERLINLHETMPDLPNSVIVGGVKLTYVSPTTRNTIDSKKLKEEEPELAKKFTKTTNVKASVRIDGI